MRGRRFSMHDDIDIEDEEFMFEVPSSEPDALDHITPEQF